MNLLPGMLSVYRIHLQVLLAIQALGGKVTDDAKIAQKENVPMLDRGFALHLMAMVAIDLLRESGGVYSLAEDLIPLPFE